MLVDSTTLKDLEVFDDASGQGGLFGLLDRTETRVGRRAFRRRLRNPLTSAEDIRAVQDAVRFLSDWHPSRSLLERGLTEALERYLDSNIEVPSGGALERIELAVRYRGLLEELRDGVAKAASWVRQARRLAESIQAADPPALLEHLCDRLLEILDQLPSPTGHRSVGETVRLDRGFRLDSRDLFGPATDSFGELDALRSMAKATADFDWSFPDLIESEHFVMRGEGLVHPFIGEAVPNPIDLAGGEPMVFLTGPNMAGKTTYLRAAGITVLLAQIGMSVPAQRLELTPVEVLLTSLTPSDNLRAGLSFFQAEVLRVREAAVHLAEGRRAFVVFDEVFKGTNVHDALEASTSVIAGFAQAEGSGFMFSSHLVELVGELEGDSRVAFYYFDGSIGSDGPTYSYRIKEGFSDQRFGLLLLGEAEVPELIARIGRGTA